MTAPARPDPRRDARRLRRLQRAATWLCCAAGLGLLGLLPPPQGWCGVAGLALLLPLAPLLSRLHLPALRRAPLLLAAGGGLVAWLGPWDPAVVPPAVLAALLALEPLAAPAQALPGRAPLLALLAALLACTLTARPALAPALVLAGAAAASALVLGAFDGTSAVPARSRPVVGWRPALALVALLAVAGGLAGVGFLATPRLPDRPPRVPLPAHRLLGYSARVEVGELARALDDPTPIFRVEVSDPAGRALPGPFYFRAVALDAFDGRVWSATGPTEPLPASVPAPGATLVQRFRFEPTAPPVLVAVPRLVALSIDAGQLDARPNGALLDRAGPRVHGYEAWSVTEPAGDPAGPPPAALFLALPPGLDPRILDLARATAGQGSSASRAAALAGLLKTRYRYQRQPDPEPSADPLAAFLLEGRPGHCELFATALAVMLRAADVPSRVVNGFYGGEWNAPGGYWRVRHSDAHSWVEAWLPGQGWVSLDATPPQAPATASLVAALGDGAVAAWTHRVLALDTSAQVGALAAPGASLQRALGATTTRGGRAFDIALSLALGLAALGLLVPVVRNIAAWFAGNSHRRPRPAGDVERAWRAAQALARRRGWRPPAHLPPVAAAGWVVARVGEPARPLADLAALHYRVKYGGDEDRPLAGEARRALAALGDLPRAPRADASRAGHETAVR